MKKSIRFAKQALVAALSAFAGMGAIAQSSVTIGGTMDLSLRQVRNGSVGTLRSEASGANSTSKLVIRGSEDLGGGRSAGFYLDGTILGDTGAAGASASFKDPVVGASYDFGFAKLDMAQRRWSFGADKMVNTHVGAVMPAGPGAVKLTYLRGDRTGSMAALSANDATLIGADYVYDLSKRTALYGHAARIANQGAAVFAIAGGPAVSATSTAAHYFGGQRSTACEFGLRHDF